MIFWLLFAVLNAIYIGALLWCVMAIRTTTRIGAEIMDIHTDALRKQSAEIATLRESQFPRYTDAVVPLPAVSAYPPEIADLSWEGHDRAVADAIAHALPGANAAQKLAQNAAYGRKPGGWQHQPMRASECPSCGSPDPAAKPVVDTGARLEFKCADKWHNGGGVQMADPETAPFFTQSQPEK